MINAAGGQKGICGTGGFSLLELLMVIAIISTLLAIATIQSRSMMNRYAIEGEAKSLHSDLLQARVRAVQRKMIHCVKFEPTMYTITEDTNPNNEACDATDGVVTQQTLDARFPLSWSGDDNPIMINAKGLIATAQTGTARFTYPTEESGEYDCVRISEVRVTTGRWDGTYCVEK